MLKEWIERERTPGERVAALKRYEPEVRYIGAGEYVAECVRADGGDYYLAADVDAAVARLSEGMRQQDRMLRQALAALNSLLRHVERSREAGLFVSDDVGPENFARDIIAILRAGCDGGVTVSPKDTTALEEDAKSGYGYKWTRALRIADDAAESVICTEGHSTADHQWVLTHEQIAADPYLEDCIAHLEWRGRVKRLATKDGVTVIFGGPA